LDNLAKVPCVHTTRFPPPLVARSCPSSCELVSTVARACDAMQTATCMPAAHEVAREGVNHACICVHSGASGPVPPASPTRGTQPPLHCRTRLIRWHNRAALRAPCVLHSAEQHARSAAAAFVRPCVVTAALLTGERDRPGQDRTRARAATWTEYAEASFSRHRRGGYIYGQAYPLVGDWLRFSE
jgi:hypothetical protein